MFGARRHDLVASHDPWEIRVTQPADLLNGVTLPSHLVGRVFREELQLEKGSEGRVVAVFEKAGTPAVVVRRTGKGQTILLGFSLGIPLLENHDPGAAALLRAVWQSAGVKPPIQIAPGANSGSVEAVVHSRGREDERLVYLLNWGHRPRSARELRVRRDLLGRRAAQARGREVHSRRADELARTLVERLELRAQHEHWKYTHADKEQARHDTELVQQVLDEMIQAVVVVDRVPFLAGRAGFNLKKPLIDYLNDVQVVTEFDNYREELLNIFRRVVETTNEFFPEADLYIIAHSEGTVITFMGLLKGLSSRRGVDRSGSRGS